MAKSLKPRPHGKKKAAPRRRVKRVKQSPEPEPAPQPPKTTFESLPKEVKSMIYKYIVPESSVDAYCAIHPKKLGMRPTLYLPKHYKGIFIVNKQINKALKMTWFEQVGPFFIFIRLLLTQHQKTFRFYSSVELKYWFRDLPKEDITKIRCLDLHDWKLNLDMETVKKLKAFTGPRVLGVGPQPWAPGFYEYVRGAFWRPNNSQIKEIKDYGVWIDEGYGQSALSLRNLSKARCVRHRRAVSPTVCLCPTAYGADKIPRYESD
jgi:hypothetical protein